MENKEHGYKEVTKTFLIETTLGDRWLNKDVCDFYETKSGDGRIITVVKEKDGQ